MTQFAVVEDRRVIGVQTFEIAQNWAKVPGRRMRRATAAEIAEEMMMREAADNHVNEDAGVEAYFENIGWQEALLDEQMEAERGVISFEDAMAEARLTAQERAEEAASNRADAAENSF